MNILDELNTPQREAATHKDGPLLIIAGAGAGKTKTLTYRISNLIENGVEPQNILAITFTNKAAKEMADRVFALLKDPSKPKPFVSTFHSLGVHILRENGLSIGVPRNFSILDRSDTMSIIRKILKLNNIDPKQFEPKKFLGAISHHKSNLKTIADYEKGSNNDYFSQMLAKVWRQYEDTNTKRKSLDFDDLITKTALLLKNNKNVLEEYQNKWSHIHVDEYQDTNTPQHTITRLLSQKSKNICVVGDGDQNIYSWRGADMKNILNFEKDYKDAKVILLEQNYRSTQTILGAANNIIKKNKIRVEKNLFTENPDGDLITVYLGYNEKAEARYIARTSKELISKGAKPEDIAVLYRANFQSRALEEAFIDFDVPYQVLGIKFFERKEVKDALSYLKASHNPDSTIEVERVINTPTRGIGKVTLDKIFNGQEHTLTPKMQERVQDFWKILEDIKQKSEEVPTSQLIKFILERSGLEKSLNEGVEEDMTKLENLQELVSLATKYDNLPFLEGVERLLSDAALATDQDSLSKPESAVKLTTVHASKGLEFPIVFITGLERDLFPHRSMGERSMTEDREEEERRLFYVAVTRAEKKLYLTHTSMRTIFGSQQINSPSEFLEDIDEKYLDGEEQEESPDTDKIVYLDL